MTGTSTLDPDNFPVGRDRTLGRGHGTGALGPSDTSDSGSDVTGGSGLAQQDQLDLGSGTTSDLDAGTAAGTAGPDLGDANLDSDTDSYGTGERAAAGRDSTAAEGYDIGTDQVIRPGLEGSDEEMPGTQSARRADAESEATGRGGRDTLADNVVQSDQQEGTDEDLPR